MGTRLTMPLSTYVLYHSEYSDGEKAFDMIYQLLCRDVERPLTDGIDIPTFLRTANDTDNIIGIDLTISKKTAIILLIDENMFCSSVWRKYIDNLSNIINEDVKLYAIGLCQYAFEISKVIQYNQSITLNNYNFKENWNLIQTRLLESLYRLITCPNQKIKLFISHAKKDCLNEAKRFRDYLNSSTKLSTFFDENDILDGNDFRTQIEGNVKSSLLVILKTDVYSEREWCRNEVLVAKRNKIPTIVVNCISKRVKRMFPYIGNCPMLQYNGTWDEIVLVLLRTALNQVYQSLLLEIIKDNSSNISNYIPSTPELFSFITIKDKEGKILYPEPPLGNEELSVLSDFSENISFVTPTEAMANNFLNIKNKKIALSVSESDDMQKYGCSKTMLKDVVLELSRYILKAGGELVYGGDLRKDGYTESFENFSYQYGSKEGLENKPIYFTNYFAWPIYLNISKSDQARFIHNRVNTVFVEPPIGITADKFIPPVGNENLEIWAKSLTKMRETMENVVDARIIIGGRLFGFKGQYAGVIEEFLIANKSKHPIYLIGGFGGAAKAIIDIRKGEEVDLKNDAYKTPNYGDFVKYFNSMNEDKIDYESIIKEIEKSQLNNGLTDEENETLSTSINILGIVSLILKGLNNCLKKG